MRCNLIGENGDKGEIKNEIEAYVALYQREHMGTLPNNMAILYDYLTLVGDTNWYAAPAAVVSTKNVDAIRINNSGGSGGSLTGPQVISSVLDSMPASAPSAQPAVASQNAVSHAGKGPCEEDDYAMNRVAMKRAAFAVALVLVAGAASAQAQKISSASLRPTTPW